MTLVHEGRKETTEIKLTKTGFRWNDNEYSSLSTACMQACRRVISGTVMFNFNAHNNISVKGKSVPGGLFRRVDAEKQEAAE